MMVTADEVGRSVRGTVDLLNQRTEGLRAFDMSETGFWHSFAAIWLTLPAYVVSLALEQHRLDAAGLGHLDAALMLVVGLAHVAGFVALPLAMIGITRRLRLTHRFVPFVIVINWVTVVGLTILSVPAILLLIGWASPPLASLFTVAFAIVVLRLQWFAAKVTLGVSGALAFGIILLEVGLNLGIGSLMRGLIG
jgi:hypothetical protein